VIMRLPRFLANIVRAGASPEIVTTRNFDDLASTLESYAQVIEELESKLAELKSKVALKAPSVSPNLVTPALGAATATSLALSGHINLNGATDVGSYFLNVKSGNMGISRSGGIGGALLLMGVGEINDATAGNTEYMQLSHDGATAALSVLKTGTGTYRDFSILTSGVERFRVSAAGAITLPGTLTSSAGGGYEEGSFPATLTGCTTSPTGTAYYTRVGKNVTVRLPFLEATSNSIACTLTGFPAELTPTHTPCVSISVMDNGTNAIRVATLSGTTLSLWGSASITGPFTASGIKGIDNNGATFTYTLQ